MKLLSDIKSLKGHTSDVLIGSTIKINLPRLANPSLVAGNLSGRLFLEGPSLQQQLKRFLLGVAFTISGIVGLSLRGLTALCPTVWDGNGTPLRLHFVPSSKGRHKN